jgi:squalene-hopene/tetraprenyl-beta-curcumene cyclase
LVPAIVRRYGKDRTFSVPILTLCALAGRLGDGPAAWRWVPALPFELAACPHRWFAALRLPVVSYALPALIAIGQVRHHHRPSRNPLTRLARHLSRGRTLQVLAEIQPASGGFLEATPLTSFVAMSLAGGGRVDHPTTRHAVEFLRASARPDGSWPIDTHLATWLTTLAVNALGAGEGLTEMPAEERGAVRAWLLAQQYQQEHPYTHAAPGGWAWTPLSGGVPDADDTASALVALKKLGELDTQVRAAALAGAEWLLQLQNRDGGVPTFCRGWTHLPFDRSSPDLTAHAMRAWAVWQPEMPPGRQPALLRAMDRALNYLAAQQRPTGCWIPLWFGSQHAADEENPVYGTARVVSALSDLGRPESPARVQRLLQTGATWLLNAQRPDGSWGGSSAAPPSVEETALAVEALAALGGSTASHAGVPAVDQATRRGVCWLIDRVEDGTWRQPAPIGFYFAKLWYYERLYPLLFTVGALERVSQLTGGQTQDSA